MGHIFSMTERTWSLTQLFDYYELRARVIPAVLVFLPLILSSISVTYVLSNLVPWATGSGLLALAVTYALSFHLTLSKNIMKPYARNLGFV